jgi:uncharacterized membrane protein YtjA (UPF0391 family)
MRLGLRRFLAGLGVIALAMMFGSSAMALRRGFVMFRRLRMGFPRHSIFPWLECRCPLNSPSVVIVPPKTRNPPASHLPEDRLLGLDRRLIPWNIGVANALPASYRRSTKRDLMLSWAIAFLVVVALIAGALGSGVLAGTAFVAAKVMFVLALLAFFISAVVEVTRRGAP